MRTALIALTIFLLVSAVYGTLKPPTIEDLMLLISSGSLLVLSWLYKESKKYDEKKNSEEKKKK
ncbi:MAG: hypothetical protein QW486_09375 [Candidatus Bathyarchaeia archaeon]